MRDGEKVPWGERRSKDTCFVEIEREDVFLRFPGHSQNSRPLLLLLLAVQQLVEITLPFSQLEAAESHRFGQLSLQQLRFLHGIGSARTVVEKRLRIMSTTLSGNSLRM